MKQNIIFTLLLMITFINQNTQAQASFTQDSNNVEHNTFYQPRVQRSVAHLLAFPKLQVFIPNCDFDMKFKVIRYECHIQSKKHEDQFFAIQGANYPPELVEAIRNLNRGDKIYFDHIRCVGEDKLVRTIAGKEITIE